MNGANIGTFDLTAPADTQSAGLGDDHMRSIKSTFQQALDDEHSFPSNGGATVGYHRYGSARVFIGNQSLVSSAGTDGRLMQASDTSRLFGVGSGGTVLLGGPRVIQAGDFPETVPQRHYWAEDFGVGITASSGTTLLTFPNSGYSGIPYIFCTSIYSNILGGDNDIAFDVSVRTIGEATAIIRTLRSGTETLYGAQQFFWRSIGTRVL